jgi:hypothetical protein
MNNNHHRLGIIVPYRDRYRQLIHFKKSISEYLDKTGIDYEVIIVEQDNASAFNRGMLLNIGAKKAKELGCTYVVFHDIDMIPIDVDYSYSDNPTHLANTFLAGDKALSIPFEQYFGGVTLFPLDKFEQINGYSNDYWGWGFEDDDLFHRVKIAGLQTDLIADTNYVASSTALQFNGVDSHITIDNVINYKRNFTLHISFNIEGAKLDHKRPSDRYPIFNVPGYDFTLYYDSFKRYNLEVFDRRGRISTIVSDIVDTKHSKATVTYNAKTRILKLFIDKNLIGEVTIEDALYNYSKSRYIYIGCSDPSEDAYNKLSFFKGSIDCIAIYSSELDRKTVHALVDNSTIGLGSKFDGYNAGDKLEVYYDPKFIRHYKLINIASEEHHGNIQNCWVTSNEYIPKKYRAIPKRRGGKFKLLDHEPGGYIDGRWKDQLTRYNQLKFTNEMLTGQRSLNEDGLDTCEYKEHSETVANKFKHYVVGI